MCLPDGLPDDYLNFLNSNNNGLSAYHGYYKLLGRAVDAPYNLRDWNAVECWRFAWSELKTSYFFIGFSVWGDHYAFDLANIDKGIVLLDAYEMVEESITRSFEGFMKQEFSVLNTQLYDSKVCEAFNLFGELQWEESITLIPPLLLSESEDVCQFAKSNMRTMMILNGDLYTQLSNLTDQNIAIQKFETFCDEKNRERLKIVV